MMIRLNNLSRIGRQMPSAWQPRLLLFCIAIVFSVVGCEVEKATQNNLETPSMPNELLSQRQDNKSIEQAKSTYNSLVSHFNIENSNTYRHKIFTKSIHGNGTTIRVFIQNNMLKCYSVYVGNSRKYHDDLQVLTTYIAEGIIPVIDGQTEYKVVDGKTVETVELNDYRAEWVVSEIAKVNNITDNRYVNLYLGGRNKMFYEYSLSDKYIKAIWETNQLFNAIKVLQKADINPLTLQAADTK